jgi:hypothetical protein
MERDATFAVAAKPCVGDILASKWSVQDHVPPRAQCRNRTTLLSLASANGFLQRQHRAGQVQVDCFLGQHRQALQHVGCCCMSSRLRQIVVNRGQGNLCIGHIT